MKKRILSGVLTCSMLFTMLPMGVFATDNNITAGHTMADIQKVVTAVPINAIIKPTGPEVEAALEGNSIYGNGFDLKIIAGDNDTTTIQWRVSDEADWVDLGVSTTNADLSEFTIFGGAKDANVANTSIEMTGGTVLAICGGGFASTANAEAHVTGSTNVVVSGGTVTEKVYTFTDVKKGDWYYDAVAFVLANDIMGGTTDTTFAPSAVVERGMLVTMLHKMSGDAFVNYAMKFTDVDADAYYAEAVRWAVSEGVTSGTSDTTFEPNSAITREQMITMLWRYSDSPMLMDYEGLTAYIDAGDISAYARQAFVWAHQQGIIGGTSDTILDPQGNATRAEVAVVIQNLM